MRDHSEHRHSAQVQSGCDGQCSGLVPALLLPTVFHSPSPGSECCNLLPCWLLRTFPACKRLWLSRMSGFCSCAVQVMALGCLFLACKVEEEAKRLRVLMNVGRHVLFTMTRCVRVRVCAAKVVVVVVVVVVVCSLLDVVVVVVVVAVVVVLALVLALALVSLSLSVSLSVSFLPSLPLLPSFSSSSFSSSSCSSLIHPPPFFLLLFRAHLLMCVFSPLCGAGFVCVTSGYQAGQLVAPLELGGDSYHRLKQRIIKAERLVLKELGFCVHLDHPHKV